MVIQINKMNERRKREMRLDEQLNQLLPDEKKEMIRKFSIIQLFYSR